MSDPTNEPGPGYRFPCADGVEREVKTVHVSFIGNVSERGPMPDYVTVTATDDTRWTLRRKGKGWSGQK
jgi:hypothetical protein